MIWIIPIVSLVSGIAGYFGASVSTLDRLMPYLSDASDEIKLLETKYQGERHSANSEEWIVRDFFADKRDGVFVDVGANHYQRYSNTYYLETELGWSGIAVEPQADFAADYAKYRPRTTFVPLFVSDTSDSEAVLYIPRNNLVASQSREFAEVDGDGVVAEVKARTTTLDDVLQRAGVERVDFLSMDIELAEPAALKGFSIRRYRPALVCIESHLAVRQQILDYFMRNGYVAIGKYLRADGHNLWFTTLDNPAP